MTRTESLAGISLDVDGKAAMMERALGSAGISFIFQDAAMAIRHAENLPQHMASQLMLGGDDIQLFGEADGARLLDVKRGVLETGKPANAELEAACGDGTRIYEIKMERTGGPGAYGILSVMAEITESRHREKVLKSLLRELSHRSKNLLAIIQGIATQTARNTLSIDSFLTKFRGRLQSLSNSQDLITDSSWRGAYLFDLAARQFSPYWPDTGIALPFHGIDAHLTPNAAVHIGLAIHELIVNSASHGAISSGATSIKLTCMESELEGKKAIEIVWSERVSGPSSAQDFEDNSFSRTVLERVVPMSMNGRSTFVTDADRIDYAIVVPASEYEILRR